MKLAAFLLVFLTYLCTVNAYKVANIYSDDEFVEALSTIPRVILLQGDKKLRKTALAGFYFKKHDHHFLEHNWFPMRYITNLDRQQPRVGMFHDGKLLSKLYHGFSNMHLWFYRNFPRHNDTLKMYKNGESMSDKHAVFVREKSHPHQTKT